MQMKFTPKILEKLNNIFPFFECFSDKKSFYFSLVPSPIRFGGVSRVVWFKVKGDSCYKFLLHVGEKDILKSVAILENIVFCIV